MYDIKEFHTWSNFHKTIENKLVEKEFVFLKGAETNSYLKFINKVTTNLTEIIDIAKQSNLSLRSYGAKWSLSNIGFDKNCMVSQGSNALVLELPKSYLRTGLVKGDYFLVGAGTKVKNLSFDLTKKRKKSITTCGASNGQTIAGAISNCTHGAAINYGSMPEFVRGIHVLYSTNKMHYVERASSPVTSKKLANNLKAELIRDDDYFNALLVSYGTMGLIQNYVIEVEDLFVLKNYVIDYSRSDLNKLLKSELSDNLLKSIVPKENKRPDHLKIVYNPYSSKQIVAEVMFKKKFKNQATLITHVLLHWLPS